MIVKNWVKRFGQNDRRWSRKFRLFLLLTLAVPLAANAEPVPVQQTKVTVFRPDVPAGSARAGECWTDSIAVSRSGAWRCMAGNEIYDPCFSSLRSTHAVICNANPAAGSAGFTLGLTKPLPHQSSPPPVYSRPWLVKLADGATCQIETGTTALVEGLQVPYGCSDSNECNEKGCPHLTGLTDRFQEGKVWLADKITFSSAHDGLRLISRIGVPIIHVWN